jgi:hypothetical protein
MDDPLGWAGLAATIVGLVIAYITYVRRHKKKVLSYVVVGLDRLGTKSAKFEIDVSFNGSQVQDPSIAAVRIVNSGEQSITADDYEGPLAIQFEGVSKVLAVDLSARRPGDLTPRMSTSPSSVLIEPMLLNPGDMLELNILSSGYPRNISLVGRIKDLPIFDRRSQLPYPPGSGAEGQMLGFDKFMWFGLMPVTVTALSAIGAHGLAARLGAGEFLALAFAAVASGSSLAAYSLRTKHLVNRRRLWRP